MQQVKNVQKFRIPCIITVISFFALRFVDIFLRGLLNPVYLYFDYIFNFSFVAAFIVLSIGNIYYGRRLYKFFPRPLDKRMKRVTINLSGLSLMIAILFILSLVLYPTIQYNPADLQGFLLFTWLFWSFILVIVYWWVLIFALPGLKRMWAKVKG